MRELIAQTRPPVLGLGARGDNSAAHGPVAPDTPESTFLRQVLRPGNVVWSFGSRTSERYTQYLRYVGDTGKVIAATAQHLDGTATLPADAQGRCDVVIVDDSVNAVSLLCRQARVIAMLRPLLVLELNVNVAHSELAGVLDALGYRLFEQAALAHDTVMVMCAPQPSASRAHPSEAHHDVLAVYGPPRHLAEHPRSDQRPRFDQHPRSDQRPHSDQLTVPGDASTGFFGSAILPYVQSIRALIKASGAISLLEYGAGTLAQYSTPVAFGNVLYPSLQDYWGTQDISAYEPSISGFDTLPAGPFDGVLCADLLTRIPPQDAPWVVHELCARGQRFVFARIVSNGEAIATDADPTLRTAAWWVGVFECIASQYGIAYLLAIEDAGQSSGTPPQWYGNFALNEVAQYLN